MKILSAGIHKNVPAEAYHRDPCPAPSLSASMSDTLLYKSPRHAWTDHPALNPEWEPDEPDPKLDFGTVAHKLLLGRGRDVVQVDAKDWRTGAAQAERKSARADGKVAILKSQFVKAQKMVDSARAQLRLVDDCFDAFTEGDAEAVLTWQESPISHDHLPTQSGNEAIWCRSMIDWRAPRRDTGHVVIYDYKTTDADISADTIGHHLFSNRYEIPAAMYERGLERLIGDCAGRVVVRFVVQEKDPPYLLHVAEMGPDGMMIGRKKVAYAIALWRRCLMENNWPGYPTRIIRADMPSFLESRWLERELREDDASAEGDDPFLIASAWVPPTPPKTLTLGD